MKNEIKAICEATLEVVEEMVANGTMTPNLYVSIIENQNRQISIIIGE